MGTATLAAASHEKRIFRPTRKCVGARVAATMPFSPQCRPFSLSSDQERKFRHRSGIGCSSAFRIT